MPPTTLPPDSDAGWQQPDRLSGEPDRRRQSSSQAERPPFALDMFSGENFFRIHRSHLINLEHLVKYVKGEGGYVEMSDGSKAEVSRRKKSDFMDFLKN